MRLLSSRIALAALLVVATSVATTSCDDVGDDGSSGGAADGGAGSGQDGARGTLPGTDAEAGGGPTDAMLDGARTADAPDPSDAVASDAMVDATLDDASGSDAAVADAGVPDTASPDAGQTDGSALEAGAPDASVDAGAKDAAAPDSSVPDSSVPDSSVPDAGVLDARAPDAGPTGGACTGFNGGAPCTPTEQRFVDKSLECYKCMVNSGCLDDATFSDTGHECGDVGGTAARGAKAGTPRTSLCLDTLDCILRPTSLCAADDVNLCYCGSLGAGNGCATATSGADGKCLHEEVDGLEHSVTDAPSAVLPDYNALALGAGMANQLFVCAKSNGCDDLCAK